MARDLIPGHRTLKAIKIGDPRKRISDGDGLYLLLLFVKGGAHGWRFDYSHGGKRKNSSLGTYPDTGLALSRMKVNEARRLLAEGSDPGDLRKQAKAKQQEQTDADKMEAQGLPPVDSFEAVAREWLATVHQSRVGAGHAERTQIRLEQGVFPWIGRKRIAEVNAPDVPADLSDALTPVKVSHRAALTDPKQVGELLRAMHDYKGLPSARAALMLAHWCSCGRVNCAEPSGQSSTSMPPAFEALRQQGNLRETKLS